MKKSFLKYNLEGKMFAQVATIADIVELII